MAITLIRAGTDDFPAAFFSHFLVSAGSAMAIYRCFHPPG
jgi:hypothetical protein